MTILDLVTDRSLARTYFGNDLRSWWTWIAALRVLYGLPLKTKRQGDLVRECTGRAPEQLPTGGFQTSLMLNGRRSGKSRIAALIAGYEAVLGGHEDRLDVGEVGYVVICSPTRSQSHVVRDYLRGLFDASDLLAGEVIREDRSGFDLRNGIRVRILAGDPKSVRGFTTCCVVVDEVCHFGREQDAAIKSDAELIGSLAPGLATTGGKLVCISTPHVARGWAYQTWKRYHGNDAGSTLVWRAPSLTMNPTLDPRIVERALDEDLARGRSEFLACWREDVSALVPRSVVEACVVEGRSSLLPRDYRPYFAFADVSGGRVDDAALAIAHAEGEVVIIDSLVRYRAPFNPNSVIAEMCREVSRFHVRTVVGDRYGAAFTEAGFRRHEVRYKPAELPKSGLYLELLPRLTSGTIQLPDDSLLVDQLASLERRVRAGGRDTVDHPPGPGHHDDVANAVAGVAVIAAKRKRKIGAIRTDDLTGERFPSLHSITGD